jgi:anthranilate phosphoribosyltransferase
MPFIAQTLQRLGEQHSLVVHGSDGSDEITNTGITYILEVFPDRIEEYTITPEQFGIKTCTLADIVGGTPEDNVEISMEIFRGKKGPHRDIIVLNSAATLYVAGVAPTLVDAVKLAEVTIDSGKALKKLEEIRTFTNREDIKNL